MIVYKMSDVSHIMYRNLMRRIVDQKDYITNRYKHARHGGRMHRGGFVNQFGEKVDQFGKTDEQIENEAWARRNDEIDEHWGLNKYQFKPYDVRTGKELGSGSTYSDLKRIAKDIISPEVMKYLAKGRR